MARLNDPPLVSSGSLESVDALKRRFIRQNREIARANSSQSLRIRSLEAETSRLLSENITLREQVIKLQYEVDRSSSRRTIRNVELVKGQLEAKLAELGTLVLELANVKPNRRSSVSPIKDHGERKSPKTSPDQKNWKNALTLSEVTSGQDGRLPAILEDKLYPRRTLDANELLSIFHDPTNTANSPDLGPPPVARFEGDCDPIKYDAASSGHEEVTAIKSFTNLENRKKRRESSIGREFARLETLDSIDISTMPQTREIAVGGQPPKLGAKRKLGARDDEDRGISTVPNEKDGFQFNRRNEALDGAVECTVRNTSSTCDAKANPKSSQDHSGVRALSREKFLEGMNSSNTRKALGDKTVNTDPVVSPVRATKANAGEKTGDFKKDVSKKPRDRDRREKSSAPKVIRLPEKRVEPRTASVEHLPKTAEPPPETPAQPDLNIFSPLSTEPSAPRPESRDTPPPEDLHTDTLAITGRTIRRPRGSVSYAEPNLRDKMRRPTKELVDAVGADERIQRAASVKIENEKGGDDEVVFEKAIEKEKEKTRTVVIKKEDETSWPAAWKSLPATGLADDNDEPAPASPLGTKTSSNAPSAHVPSIAIVTSRKRRPSTLPAQPTSPPAKNHSRASGPTSTSGSATTIATLAAIPHRHPSRPDLPTTTTAAAEKSSITARRSQSEAPATRRKSDLDVYDFHASSPTETIETKEPQEHLPPLPPKNIQANEVADSKPQPIKKIRESRRYSSVPEGLGKNAARGEVVMSIRGGRGGKRESITTTTTSAAALGGSNSNIQNAKGFETDTRLVTITAEGAVAGARARSREGDVGTLTSTAAVLVPAPVPASRVLDSGTGRRERAVARRRSGVL